MSVKMDGNLYEINDNILKGVFFRAPVFLRSHKKYNVNEQLYRSQWSSFIRNLVVFESLAKSEYCKRENSHCCWFYVKKVNRQI